MIDVWIDATRPASHWNLWGMSLVERQLRQMALNGVCNVYVAIVDENTPPLLRPDFAARYDLTMHTVRVEGRPALFRQMAASPAPLFLNGDVVYDDRIIDRLFDGGPGTYVGDDDVYACWLDDDQISRLAQQAAMGEPENAWKMVATPPVDVASLSMYVPELRLTMVPILVRVETRAQLFSVDRLMYRRTFKGVIDFVASHGYYHLVRWITRQLAPTRVSPNIITVLSILGIWVTVPCFAAGALGFGIGAAWVGVIADSVDGKLARLTLHLSAKMGKVEHLSATPALGLWLLALGGHLAGWDLLQPATPVITTWVLTAAFTADKFVTAGFKKWMGCEIFDYNRFDALFHKISARRNILLLMISIGAVIDALLVVHSVDPVSIAYACMAAWMSVTFAVHVTRALWVVAVESKEREADLL